MDQLLLKPEQNKYIASESGKSYKFRCIIHVCTDTYIVSLIWTFDRWFTAAEIVFSPAVLSDWELMSSLASILVNPSRNIKNKLCYQAQLASHLSWMASLKSKGKGKGLDTCYSATYMSQTCDQQRFIQSRKWQLIGMNQWRRSALCGHPLPALTDNWTHGAASRHTIAPISHTRPSPCSRSYYSFPVPLRVGGWVGLSIQ